MQKMSQRNERLPMEISVELNTSINILLMKCDDQFEGEIARGISLHTYTCAPLNIMKREGERERETICLMINQ